MLKDTFKKYWNTIVKSDLFPAYLVLSMILIAMGRYLIKEEEDLTVQISLSFYFYFLPLLLSLYFFLKTKNLRKLDPNKMKIEDANKVLEMKNDSRNCFWRTFYIFVFRSGRFGFLEIFFTNFAVLLIVLLLLTFLFGLYNKNIFSGSFERNLFLCFLILFLLVLVMIISLTIGKKVSYKKILKGLIYYLPVFSFLLTFSLASLGSLIIYKADFFKPNCLLSGLYMNFAQISFLIFTGLFIIIGVIDTYFKVKKDLNKKFRNYIGILNRDYKIFLKNKPHSEKNFSEFLIKYLNDEIEIDKERDIDSLKNKLLIFYKFKNYIPRYGIFGIFFITYSLLPFPQTNIPITLDICVLITFLAFIFYDFCWSLPRLIRIR